MPNASPLKAIQDALYDRLSNDGTLTDMTAVLGFEPEEPPENFIMLGNATEEQWNTLGGLEQGWGWEDTVTVHIYSYYKGDIRALEVLNQVTALLNFYELVLTGYPTVLLEYGNRITKVLIETKGKRERRHIPALFTIRCHD